MGIQREYCINCGRKGEEKLFNTFKFYYCEHCKEDTDVYKSRSQSNVSSKELTVRLYITSMYGHLTTKTYTIKTDQDTFPSNENIPLDPGETLNYEIRNHNDKVLSKDTIFTNNSTNQLAGYFSSSFQAARYNPNMGKTGMEGAVSYSWNTVNQFNSYPGNMRKSFIFYLD